MGFDYFYGFIGGETHQYYPVLFENTDGGGAEQVAGRRLSLHGRHDGQGDPLDCAIAKSVAPEKPFLAYFRARRGARAPSFASRMARQIQRQVRRRAGTSCARRPTSGSSQMGVIPRRHGQLTPRPEWVKPLGFALRLTSKRLYAALHGELLPAISPSPITNAARLLDAVARTPGCATTRWSSSSSATTARARKADFRGTVNEVMNLNGTAVEPRGQPEDDRRNRRGRTPSRTIPLGWAWAGNAPFQWVKQIASHLGGTRNPMVVSWPAQDQGRRRHSQPVHASDRHDAHHPRGRRTSRAEGGQRRGAEAARWRFHRVDLH